MMVQAEMEMSPRFILVAQSDMTTKPGNLPHIAETYVRTFGDGCALATIEWRRHFCGTRTITRRLEIVDAEGDRTLVASTEETVTTRNTVAERSAFLDWANSVPLPAVPLAAE